MVDRKHLDDLVLVSRRQVEVYRCRRDEDIVIRVQTQGLSLKVRLAEKSMMNDRKSADTGYRVAADS